MQAMAEELAGMWAEEVLIDRLFRADALLVPEQANPELTRGQALIMLTALAEGLFGWLR